MTEYVHVGRHADILQNGRGLGPGERVQDGELGDEDRYLVDDGVLVDIKSFGGPSNSPGKDEPPAPGAPTTTAAPPVSPPADTTKEG